MHILPFFDFFQVLQNYNKTKFFKDINAGIIVGIIALPQALAFSVLSGLPPEWGLYAAIIGGLFAAIFGGSEHNVTGPTSALAIILGVIVSGYGPEMVLVATLMVGIIQVSLSFFKVGSLVRYIPQPVLIGFSTGVALLIFTSQFPKLFDVSIGASESLMETVIQIWKHMVINGEGNIYAGIIGCIAMGTIFGLHAFPKTRKLPNTIIGLIVAGTIALLAGWHIKVLGHMPASLPSFHFPWELITINNLRAMIPHAIALATLASVESLATAEIASKMSGVKYRVNKELFGQGIANMACGFFSGTPVTGAFSRVAANVRSGAMTRMASIFHALFILLVLLVLAPYTYLMPTAALAGLLITVSFRMVETHYIKSIFSALPSDKLVFLVTLGTTMIFDLVTAIAVGVFLAVVIALRKASDKDNIHEVVSDGYKLVEKTKERKYCPQIQMIQLDAPLFFGISANFTATMKRVRDDEPKVIILRMKNVPYMDASGVFALEEIYAYLKKRGGQLIIAGANKEVLDIMKSSGLYEKIGKENFATRTEEAIKYFFKHHIDKSRCEKCSYRIFTEC